MEKFDWRNKLFDSLSFPTLILSVDMSIVEANSKFLEKYKQTKKQLFGKKCYHILYGFEKPCQETSCPVLKVIKTKKGTSSTNKAEGYKGKEVYEDRVCSPRQRGG
jgi:hypothetical protein